MAEDGYEVKLYIYDLSQGLARQLSRDFLGKQIDAVYHTSIVIYGKEYSFGQGISTCVPGHSNYGQVAEVRSLGRTYVPEELFEEFLQDISPRFSAHTYSLLNHNCNNFSDEVANFLVGEGIPKHILDLPQEFLSSPMGAMFLPMLEQMEAQMQSGRVPAPSSFSSRQVPVSFGQATSTQQRAVPVTRIPVVRADGDGGYIENVQAAAAAAAAAPAALAAAAATAAAAPPTSAASLSPPPLQAATAAAGAPGAAGTGGAGGAASIPSPVPIGPASERKGSPAAVPVVGVSALAPPPAGGAGAAGVGAGAGAGSAGPAADAKAAVQAEIQREFAALMAAGSMKTSEAAVLAFRRVQERLAVGTAAAKS
eukprot:jgi/Mesen1/8487/ME000480S07844